MFSVPNLRHPVICGEATALADIDERLRSSPRYDNAIPDDVHIAETNWRARDNPAPPGPCRDRREYRVRIPAGTIRTPGHAAPASTPAPAPAWFANGPYRA